MKIHVLAALLLISQVNAKHLVTQNERDGIMPGNSRSMVLDIDEMPTILEANKGLTNLKEGDIQTNQNTRNTIESDMFGEYLWENKTIPVIYGSGTTLLTKAAVDEARREYELRTCLSFPTRTDEENYITIRVLTGCFSSVGMQGGNQIVSIGLGCEQMSTVVHEFLHAIGVWHEQSRADRDDYIEINYSAIDPDLAYNFDNYGFDETDDRRVAYDFNSVMHYGKTAFSWYTSEFASPKNSVYWGSATSSGVVFEGIELKNITTSTNGDNTIITRDPEFQDVIGQRSGFSVGDVTKISRMYDCIEPLRTTNHEDFETVTIGGYTQNDLDGNVNWIHHRVGQSPTDGPTTKYLPTHDSTFGMTGEGSFLYLDTSRGFPGQSAIIKSMRYTTNVARQCLEFSYYLGLNTGSNAHLYVYLTEIDALTGEITDYNTPIWSHTPSTLSGPNHWRVQRMTISASSSYRLVFYGRTGQYYSDVIAIDDVSIADKECDTGYFLVPEYSNLMATYEVDEYYASSVMHTAEPGYAFQVLIYPNGWQSSIDAGFPGYMSIYFRLVGGSYDNELEWPFDNQFLRFVITDQGPNPTERMNYFYNFLTDASSATLGGAWQKPIGPGSVNQAVGYRTFFLAENFNTRRYLKQDVAYFSVQVTDMRNYNESQPSAQLRNPVLQRSHELMIGESVDWPSDLQPQEKNSRKIQASNEYQQTEEQQIVNGMMTLGGAALVIVITSLVVFLVMAMVTCCVARSFRVKQKSAPAVMTDIRFGSGLSKENNIKYSERKDIL